MKIRLLLALLFCSLPFLASAQTLYTTFPSNSNYFNDSIQYKFNVTSVPTTVTPPDANGCVISTGLTPGVWTINGFSTSFQYTVNKDGTLSSPSPGGVQTGPYTMTFTDGTTCKMAFEQPAFNYISEYPTSNLLPASSPPGANWTFTLLDPKGKLQWQDHGQFRCYFFWNSPYYWFGGTSLAAIVSPYPNSFPTTYTQTETIKPGTEQCKHCSGGCPTCGMTGYSLDTLHGSFSLGDTPISYTPPRGQGISFSISYNQADVGQLAVQPFSNIGPNWTYNSLSYITNRPDDVNVNVTRFAPGGGLEYYGPFTVSPTANGVFDPKTGKYSFPQTSAPERTSRAVLTWNPSLSQYTRALPDGSSEVYGQWINSGGTNYYLLTQSTDPQGNSISYAYDNQGRLVTVTDAIGQVTTYSYNSTASPMLISKVTDPFGRSASLLYDSKGRLTSCTDPLGMVSSYGYDANNNVISLTTPYGTTTFAVTSNSGQSAVTVTNPLGQPERVELDYGSVSTIPDSDPVVPTFNPAYLPAGFTLVNSGLSSNNTYYWDRKQYAAHSTLQYTDAQITHWQPGPHGLCPAPASTKQPLENRVWMVYNGQTTPGFVDDSDQTNPVATGRVLDDGTTQANYAAYNTQGNITQTVDPVGRTTNMSYDTATGIDLISVSQVNGSGSDLLSTLTYTSTTVPNSMHFPLTITDASGQTTAMTYNAQGQILTSTNPKSEKTTWTYTGPNGTGAGNYMTTVAAPMTGAITKFTYDNLGRLSTRTDSEGYTLNYSYDNLNRQILLTYPDGTTDQTIYQYLDVVKMIDRQGRVSTKLYDPIREVISTTDPLNRTTQYGWCLCGGLASLTDANHNLTQWTLDLEGRVTAKTYADSSQILYAYENTTSRLHQMQDADGNKSIYAYNEDNTLSSTTYTPGTGIAATPNVSFTYDPNYKRIKTMVDGIGTTTYTFNPVPTNLPTTGANLLGSTSAPIGLGNGIASVGTAAIAYTYDQLGRVTNYTIDGSSNNSITTTFDSLGRVTNVTNPLGAFVYAYIDTTTRLASLTYPTSTGLVSNFSYYPNVCPIGTGNGDERLETISNVKGTTNISNFGYTYNSVGTIATWQQQTDANTATQYALTYDTTDQLVNAVNTNSSTHAVVNSNAYEYDLMGNRLAETTPSGTNAGRFNILNQLTAYTSSFVTQTVSGHTSSPITSSSIDTIPATISNGTNFTANVPILMGTNVLTVQAQNSAGTNIEQRVQAVTSTGSAPTALTYDLNGNVMKDELGNSYTWDALNRLITIKYSSGATSNFAYDGQSRRTSIIEKNSSGTVASTKLYLWIGNTIADERSSTNVVQKRFYSQGEQQSGTTYFYTRDHLGSVRELMSSTGTIISRLGYDVYGKATLLQGSNLTTFQYAGYYDHQPSGFDFTKYRIYDQSIGRWLSRDPIGKKGGLNLYGYCGDNSVSHIDKLGLVCVESLKLLTSGTMAGGKNIHDYYPGFSPGYGPANPSQLGTFSNSGGTGATVQMIATTTGSGTAQFSQHWSDDGDKTSHDDVKESGQDPNSAPFRQLLPKGPSFADIPGTAGGSSADDTTYITCVSSVPSPGECCAYKSCCVEWRQDASGNITILQSWCEKAHGFGR